MKDYVPALTKVIQNGGKLPDDFVERRIRQTLEMADEAGGKAIVDKLAAQVGKALGTEVKAEYSKDKDGKNTVTLKIETGDKKYVGQASMAPDNAQGKPSAEKYANGIVHTKSIRQQDEMGRYMEQLYNKGGKAAVNVFLKDVAAIVDTKTGGEHKFEGIWDSDGKSVDLIKSSKTGKLIVPTTVVGRTKE